ncbi:MAG TPA: hypothetical protein VNJ50_13595 [Gelidibacter sp.]|jgi:hypothetical protein|uniref:hypothetical protein n=1 Tax=Gelidibacter sp. TaxID=2018083 RepID=UPI002BE08498|nr:hypothetical protein [Gelidibacter sp.]HXJ99881.1 hypothetical protein [Gelidibacter sp.]
MKKIILILLILIFSNSLFSQQATVVINQKLLEQLTKNQAVRLLSNDQIKKSTEKQRKIYGDVQGKMAKVIAINEFLYDNLRNINGLIKDGKSVGLMYDYVTKITQELSTLSQLTLDNPLYATIKYEYYIETLDQYLAVKNEIENMIMKVNSDYLLDQYDRHRFVTNVLYKLRNLYLSILGTTSWLKNANNKSLIQSIPILGTFYSIDKAIINNIMNQLNQYY